MYFSIKARQFDFCLIQCIDLSVSQKEVVLKSNSSQSALPVALGAGCDHRRLSSLDVCHQVM